MAIAPVSVPVLPALTPSTSNLALGAALRIPGASEESTSATLMLPATRATDCFVSSGANPETFVVSHNSCSRPRLACTRVGPDGRVGAQMEAALPSTGWIEQVSVDTARRLLYVLGHDSLTCLDTDSGAQHGQYGVARDSIKRFSLHPDGGITFCERDRLRHLDGALLPVSTEALGFTPAVQAFLPDGSLYLEGPSPDHGARCVSVVAPDGRVRFSTRNASPDGRVAIEDDGTAWCVEHEPEDHRTVVRFSPSDGSVDRFPTSPDATAVVPLAGGSFAVLEESGHETALTLHDAEGARRRRTVLVSPEGAPRDEDDRQHRIEEFILAADGTHALIQAGSDFPESHALYRVDLTLEPGAHGWRTALASLADRAHLSHKVAPFYQAHRFIEPQLLEDGRMVVKRVGSISGLESFDLLDPAGHVAREFHGSEHARKELQQALGGSVPLGGTSIPLRPLHDGDAVDLPSGLHQDPPALPRTPATSDPAAVPLAGPPPGTPESFQPGPGTTASPMRNDHDVLLQVPLPVDAAGPMAAIASLGTCAPLLDLALAQVVQVPVITSDGVCTFQISRDHIDVAGSATRDGHPFQVAHLDQHEASFTTALALRLGDKAALVAGATDGSVFLVTEHEIEPLGTHCQRYDLGAPVESLVLSSEGTILALAGEGPRLAIRPPVPSGGKVEAVPAASEGHPALTISGDETHVRIAGVDIPRRASA